MTREESSEKREGREENGGEGKELLGKESSKRGRESKRKREIERVGDGDDNTQRERERQADKE